MLRHREQIHRILLCCWLIVSQTGIDTSCCMASASAPAVQESDDASDIHHEHSSPKDLSATTARFVNGLGKVVDDAVCSPGVSAVKSTSRPASKSGCTCSLARKLAGKCCCGAGAHSSPGTGDKSPSPNGDLISGDSCQCADEIGSVVVLRVPSVISNPADVCGDDSLDVAVCLKNDSRCGTALEPALDPPELG